MITIREHQKIESEYLHGLDLEELRHRANYDTSRFIPTKVNLIRFEFDPANNRDGFYSYFRIGAEWLDEAHTRSVIVTPKIKGINFLEMFMTCMHTAETSDNFSSIYDIDFEAKPIKSKTLSSILSALLVVHFLMTLKRVVARGLRKGYVARHENIGKVKGRLDIRQTERNAILGHGERVFCHYEEYIVDTPENRLLKRALTVTADMIALMSEHSSYTILSAMLNQSRSAFNDVSDEAIGLKFNSVKPNKLYKEYDEAIRLAKIILRHQDMAVNCNGNVSSDTVPVFRIDMALLFEHYTLAKLRQAFGHNAVMYQVTGNHRFIADFLIKTPDTAIIADTKYIDGEFVNVAKGDYIKQLSGYARDYRFLKLLGFDPTDEDSVPVVPSLILYPAVDGPPLNETSLLTHPANNTLKFYTLPIEIPTYSNFE